jgi:catechol 2,3-dioxygenase-like lactoylglutathione lyase family enzyme
VLGVEVVEVEYGRVAYLLDGDQRLNVHGPGSTPNPRAAQPVVPGNSDLCFVWEGDVESARAHLERHGVEIELGPVDRTGARGPGTSFYFRDPDGSLLELIVYG